jgi:tRNA U34 5-carboxymethylaminomethyl modifying GTPase MnmE/TrmE
MSDAAPRSRSSRQRTPEAEAQTERTLLGTVAIVGEPNAGKSTLVNRLTATRETVVHSEPGVTRDRKQLVVEWGGDLFALIDTGGVDAGDDGPFQSEIARQAELAISEADLVLLLVDATTSPGAADLELAERLRRAGPGAARREQARQPSPRRGTRVPRARSGRSLRALGAARHRHR